VGCDAYLDDYEASEISRVSRRQLRENRSAVLRFLTGAELSSPLDVRPLDVEDHVRRLFAAGARPKTIRNHLAALGAFFTFLRRRKLVESNPVRDVEPPPLEEPPHSYLSPARLPLALSLARAAGIEAEVTLAIYAGLRMSELARLRWADVHLDERFLMVLGAKGRKNARKWRRVWLHSAAIAALRVHQLAAPGMEYVFPGGRQRADGTAGLGTWARNRPRGRDSWLSLLRPLQEAMSEFQAVRKGDTGRGWHLLRHTYASLLLQSGVRIEKISAWLGHSSIETTRRHYAWLAEGYDADCERIP
jgi:site-specific recombinase XerD